MSDTLAFLALPALACVALVGIHAYFGLHVLRRNVVFVDLALAQVAALGATVAFLLGYAPQSLASHTYALGFTLVAAAVLASTHAWSGRISQEAQIGVVYVVAAAAALLLVDRAPQGAEHIRQILTGNILTVGWQELGWAVALYAAVGLAHPLIARVAGRGWLSEFAFYAAFGLVVTSSVSLAGVLLVFAFLIIPAAIGMLYAHTPRRQLAIAWSIGAIIAMVGLALSYAADLSTGATLVCTYGAALAIAGIARLRSRLWRPARLGAAMLLAASALWIAAFPRADHPLLDSVERAFPGVKAWYTPPRALAVSQEAEQYAERYRVEAERLQAKESERRWSGQPLDEIEIRHVASFMKSYHEMMGGERFVMREVRDRARESSRFALAAAFLALSLLFFLAPAGWRRMASRRGGPPRVVPVAGAVHEAHHQ
jgi:zinc/manganese transport system permease protein